MWFFHLADKDVSWNVSLFWTLSIFFSFFFIAYWEDQKLIQHHIIAGSDEEKRVGEFFAVIAVGSSSGICSDSDDAGRRQSS